jgi:TRAP-type mannitol/chloroaromatic compound transport system permease small subunit
MDILVQVFDNKSKNLVKIICLINFKNFHDANYFIYKNLDFLRLYWKNGEYSVNHKYTLFFKRIIKEF